MGLYRDHLLPRLVDRACSSEGLRRWRAEVTAGLSGRVVEIGFGSGLNVAHYPPEVEEVMAVEPAQLARRLAARRAGAGTVPVHHIGLDGHAIPLADASCDAALSTFTLCTVADPAKALAELRRVLRNEGCFHFLEHGIAPEPRWPNGSTGLSPGNGAWRTAATLRGTPWRWSARLVSQWSATSKATPPARKPWSYFTMGVAVNRA